MQMDFWVKNMVFGENGCAMEGLKFFYAKEITIASKPVNPPPKKKGGGGELHEFIVVMWFKPYSLGSKSKYYYYGL